MNSSSGSKESKRDLQHPLQEITTIRGMVIPAEWDPNGRPTGVMIAAFDENEYHVEINAAAEGLFNRLRKVVLVQGRVNIKGGRKYIEIIYYKVIA